MSLSIESLAERGIHLVQHIEGKIARFEQIVPAGTKKFEGETLEEALANVEAHLGQHPGALGTDISRSDGASESLDDQIKHSAQVGPTDLPKPAADEAAADAETEAPEAPEAPAPEAPADGTAPEAPAADGENPPTETPEAPAAPEAPEVAS